MKNWRIGIRIGVGYAAAIAITLVLGILAYSQIGAINKNSAEIATNALPGVYLVGEIQANTQAVFGLELQHAISTNKDEMARLETEIQSIRSRNSGLYAAYEKLISNEKERGMFAALAAERASFNTTADDILKVSRVGTTASSKQAMEMTDRQLRPLHRSDSHAAVPSLRPPHRGSRTGCPADRQLEGIGLQLAKGIPPEGAPSHTCPDWASRPR